MDADIYGCIINVRLLEAPMVLSIQVLQIQYLLKHLRLTYLHQKVEALMMLADFYKLLSMYQKVLFLIIALLRRSSSMLKYLRIRSPGCLFHGCQTHFRRTYDEGSIPSMDHFRWLPYKNEALNNMHCNSRTLRGVNEEKSSIHTKQ